MAPAVAALLVALMLRPCIAFRAASSGKRLFHHSRLSMKLTTGIVGLPNVGKSKQPAIALGSLLKQSQAPSSTLSLAQQPHKPPTSPSAPSIPTSVS